MKIKSLVKLALLFLFTSCNMNNHKPQVIGHRGAMGHETENTIASIKKAMDFGVDMIEIDVFKIASGEIVVFHDDQVERLTDGSGNIEDYSLEEMNQLTLVGGHKIPLLQEVLDLMDNRTALNIELKGADTAGTVDKILNDNIHEKGWALENILISSFNWDELRQMRLNNEAIDIAILTEDDPLEAIPIAQELNAVAINPNYKTLTKENTAQIQEKGFKLFTWTVNEPDEIERLKNIGVDGIISDYPERVN